MARSKGGRPVEIGPEENVSIDRVCKARGMKRTFLVRLLLRYALNGRIDAAIDEWQREGAQAEERLRREPTPLRAVYSNESDALR